MQFLSLMFYPTLHHQGDDDYPHSFHSTHRVLEASDDVGDAHDDAAGVGPQPGTGLQLLLCHVGQEPEHLAADLRIQFEEPEKDVDSVTDWIIQNGIRPALFDLHDLGGTGKIAI